MKPTPRELRQKLGKNQSEFWYPLGATQSAGSRYESGRRVPKPMLTLLELAYGKNPLKTLAELRGTTVDKLRAGRG